jgi:acyl-CoA synthetase (AMP-forming)/AMP-acid ligase II
MACVVFDDATSRIVLFYVGDEGITPADVKRYCKETLPRYMLPYAVLPLEAMPVNPGGKADRVGLLEKYRQESLVTKPSKLKK